MSNIVEIPTNGQKSQSPANQWGVPSNAFPTYQTPQVASNSKAPLSQPAQAQVAVLSDQSQVRNRFRENTVRLQVMFTEKLNNIDGKTVIQKIISGNVAQQIFKPEGTAKAPHDIHHNGEEASSSTADLSKGIITRVAVVSTHNEFPFPVTFDFTSQGESSNCFSLDGKQFPLMLYPGEHNRGTEAEIYNAKDAVNDPFLRRYGHISVEDMWGSIQTFKNANYVYVPVDHDAIRLIRLNPDKFGPAPSQDDLREGIYYKMDGKRVADAIDELYYNIIAKFKFTDLSKFTVNMSRLDGKNFKDVSNSKWDHFDSQEQSFLMNQTLHAGFELKVTWTFPQQEANTVNKPSPAALLGTVNPVVAQQYGVFQSPTYQSFSNSKLPVTAPKLGQ